MLRLGFLNTTVYTVGTMLHGQPSAIGQCWLCSTPGSWLRYFLATQGWLWVLRGSLTASWQWQS